MSLLSAGIKLFARECNDIKLQHDLNKAKEISYKQTGKAMHRASKKGKYINGTEIYQKNLKENIFTAKTRHSNRDKFISDL